MTREGFVSLLNVGEERRTTVSESLPTPFHLVIVVCATFRCLGYIDAEKVWRHTGDNEEIKGVVIRWEPCLQRNSDVQGCWNRTNFGRLVGIVRDSRGAAFRGSSR